MARTWDESKVNRDARGRFAHKAAAARAAMRRPDSIMDKATLLLNKTGERVRQQYVKRTGPGSIYDHLLVKDRFTKAVPPGSGRDLAVKLASAGLTSLGLVYTPASLVKTLGLVPGAIAIGTDLSVRWAKKHHPFLFSDYDPTKKVPTHFKTKRMPRR